MTEPTAIADDLLPEDAYDAGDPFHERLDVLERAIKSYILNPDPIRRRPLLNLLDKLQDESLIFIDRLTEARAEMMKGR